MSTQKLKKWIVYLVSILTFITSSGIANAENEIPADSIPSDGPTTTLVETPIIPQPLLRKEFPFKPSEIVLVSHIKTRDQVVFITIDDGATVSAELADLLDSQKVAVTTFAMPGMLWRARAWYRARKHMTFENHTNTHAHMTTISRRNQIIELCWTNKIIRQMMGTAPIMYRPPRGSWDDKNRIAMARCGLKYAVLWSVVVTKDVPENLSFRPGDIILFHYIPSLPNSLRKVLEILHRQHLRPALLRDYLK